MLTEKEMASDAADEFSDVNVWLIEINSSPAVAEKLLPQFATNLINLAIDPNVAEEDGQGEGEGDDMTTSPPSRLELGAGVGDFVTLLPIDC
jgi:hypothetical protein